MQSSEFSALGLNETLCAALAAKGYESPTPIQQQAIPHLLQGTDLFGVAQTGTGKTAAFALPMVQYLAAQEPARRKHPIGLVLAPTRELALQIFEETQELARGTDLEVAVLFGGVGQNPQVKKLADGVDILVATPGRLLDLAAQKHLNLGDVEVLVLDEADRLLDMGFVRDVKKIVAQTPDSRQSLLFSATMPKEVVALASSMLHEPVRVDVSPKEVTVAAIDQRVVYVENADKPRLLIQLLRDDAVTRAIVFTRTKHGANRVAKKLMSAGIGAEAIHGNKSQNARQRALANFKSGDAWVLVATDIAARGIDIDGISHVFNFELPHEPESYVHRIGRTARAGATGVAWALVDPSERKRLRDVERLIKLSVKVVQFDLPEAAPGERDHDGLGKDERRSRSGGSGRSGNRGGGGRGRSGNGASSAASGNGRGGKPAPRRRGGGNSGGSQGTSSGGGQASGNSRGRSGSQRSNSGQSRSRAPATAQS